MKKKLLSGICAVLTAAQLMIPCVSAESTGSIVRLPGSVETIEEEAFYGDSFIEKVVIPSGKHVIRERAFAGCTSLAQITIEDGAELIIEPEAFSGCLNLRQVMAGSGTQVTLEDRAFAGCTGDFDILVSGDGDMDFSPNALTDCGEITFYAHQGGNVELYALSHGYKTVSLDAESALEQARALVAAYGTTPSALQSDGLSFESHRLIVVTEEDRLPDISAYEPVSIARNGEHTYYIQFDDDVHTTDCYNALADVVDLVEPDIIQSSNVNYYPDSPEVIQAAGVTDASRWDTDDPMGFDYYAGYVAENSSGHVTIAVIDSGIALGKGFGFEHLVSGGVNMSASGDADGWFNVTNYHGSIIASVIYSCIGSNNVDLMAIRVEESTGAIDTVLLEQAIRYATANGADIINLSLKLNGRSEFISRSIQDAIDAGVTVVAAAGNAHQLISDVFPANVPGVISVAGVSASYTLSGASGYGEGIGYAAPSEYIKHLVYKGRTSNGTSFAAPQIAAALALVKLDNTHTVSHMDASCLPIPNGGRGMPRLNELAVIPTERVVFGEDTPSLMAVGDTHRLSWEVYPEKAGDKSVTITSSNDGCVQVDVDENGVCTLTARKAGIVRIYLQANDGNSAKIAATVRVIEPVRAISLSGSTHSTWANGEAIQLTAAVTPENATHKTVYWSSSDEAVAAVDNTGLVTPAGCGSTVIRAEVKDGFGAYAEWPLTVSEYPDASSIVISDGSSTTGATMCAGEKLQLSAIIAPQEAEQEALWSVVSGTGTASISREGLLTATAGGTVTVFAFAKSDTSLSCNFPVTIKPAPESISAHAGTTVLYPGDTIQMEYDLTPAGAYLPDIKWYSTDPSVAEVNRVSGEVIAVGTGDAGIYAVADTGIGDGKAIGTGETISSEHVGITVLASPTISFEANGGSTDTFNKKAYFNQPLGVLPVPTRLNYTFTGWYTEASGGTCYTAESLCDQTEDFTLYAHWELQIFTITFNANGGSVSTASKTASVNTDIGTLPTPTRTYYTFAGWYTAANGGTLVNASTQYSSAGNITLYAHWTENGWGSWNGWDNTAVSDAYSGSLLIRQTEKRTVPTYTTRTVYHYMRYIWKSHYATSYRADGFKNSYGTNGVYQETTSYSEFEYSSRYRWDGVYHYEYKGTKVDGCTYWYDPWTTTEQVKSGEETQYRYRDRIK